jgi:hypothetical protein
LSPDVDKLNPILWWFATIGLVIAIVLLSVSIPAMVFLGWSDVWDILVGRLSPRNHSYPYLVWPLSIIGWAAIPALVGAVVGAIVSSQLAGRRDRRLEEIVRDAIDREREGGHS